ncbi:hypothetical protein PF005_g19616 [Phytophthora fragariae]|nr:hypothetical protein PF007_g27706 [Phytophthora fragariae]KAE9189514.1 hypothetical protein PF005_g19616 [Phytophthora fragariae]KAE9273349.1 hypothetical protein PF001_g27546 [Phytophthora fragariae]
MPLYTGKDGALYAAGSGDECKNYLGRSWAANELVDSGDFTSRNGETALKTIKGVSTFVKYTPSSSGTSSSQQQQQQSSQANGSQQQQSSQTNDSEQQQEQQQSSEANESEQQQGQQQEQQPSQNFDGNWGMWGSQFHSRKLAVETSNLEKEWQQTSGNFGVGKLD